MKQTPKKQENKNTIQQGILIQQEYRGILPPPNHLEHYEHILKGSTERILKMAENQAEHRINQENKLVDDNINYKKRGQHIAFILMFMLLALVAVCIFTGKETTGLFLTISAMITGITSFIYSRKDK